jgi:hypothetical protein
MSVRGGVVLSCIAAVAVTVAATVLVTRSTRASAGDRAADVNVSCAPAQRAVVRQTTMGATPQVDILCVDIAAATPAGYSAGGGQLAPTAFTPAVYYPQAAAPIAAAPRAAPASAVSTTQTRRVAQKPSWQKRALVIGGSAGAGAGIGALIGGKKGALIGAAVGGGGATVVDQVKHR